MKVTGILHAAKQGRTPLIKFLGKRKSPKSVDHTPHPHPASPTHSLPESFASYRSKAQQHGPLGGQQQQQQQQQSQGFALRGSNPTTYGAVGGRPGGSLGSIQPKAGEFFDRSELPRRFRKTPWSDEEIEAVTSGGASLFG